MTALILTLLMIAGTDVNPADLDKHSQKRMKRKLQNSLTARKSYETKKLERHILLQKNTELVEMQKKLLHDKSRLEEQVSLLKNIMNSIDHKTCSTAGAEDTLNTIHHNTCSTAGAEDTLNTIHHNTCSTAGAEDAMYPSVVPSSTSSAHPRYSYDDDNNEALDLSIRSRLSESCQITSPKNTPKDQESLKGIAVDDRIQNVSGEPVPKMAKKKRVRFEECMQTEKVADDTCSIQLDDNIQDMSQSQEDGDFQDNDEMQKEGYVQDTCKIKQENDIQDILQIKQECDDVQESCNMKQNYVHGTCIIKQGDNVLVPTGKRIKCEI